MQIPAGINFADYLDAVGQLEAQELKGAGAWRDALIERSDGVSLVGDTMPWGNTHGLFRFGPGQVTIWTGMNGHRKSMLLGHVCLHLMQTTTVAIASLEMKPTETLWRMCTQSAGSASPSKLWIDKFSQWADDRLLIYDQLDTVAAHRILGFVSYCAKALRVQHIVIDSLTKAGIPPDDRNGETQFVDRLQWIAKSTGCHIHLVTHVRKPMNAGEEWIPTKFDVRGAGQIVDLADNLIICWKNKRRAAIKAMVADGLIPSTKEQEILDNQGDQLLIVEKQRHGAWEGRIKLYDHPSLQFTTQEGRGMTYELVQEKAGENKEEEITPAPRAYHKADGDGRTDPFPF